MAKVKVRVAVAVDSQGNWNSAGGFWGHAMDEQWMANALKIVHSGAASYWLEAELDVPQETVVQAAVTRDGEP